MSPIRGTLGGSQGCLVGQQGHGRRQHPAFRRHLRFTQSANETTKHPPVLCEPVRVSRAKNNGIPIIPGRYVLYVTLPRASTFSFLGKCLACLQNNAVNDVTLSQRVQDQVENGGNRAVPPLQVKRHC